MARVVLKEGVTLKGARRMLSKRGGDFRITRRYGKLYTIKAVYGKQPNTDKQKACRELLKRANELTREDMIRPGRRDYWEKMAKEKGYKTAVGCARAWYVAWLKGNNDIAEKKIDTRETKEEEIQGVEMKREEDVDVVVISRKWVRKRGYAAARVYT